MNLDARLNLAYEMYGTCDLAADIGTDHAHLPVALMRSGKCARMILTDISESALANARANIIAARLEERTELVLGDGLLPLRNSCAFISILGMGGKTIRDILIRGREKLQGAVLILSAHTDLPEVRRAVMEIGYRLKAEEPCRAGGRYYLILKAEPGGERLTESEIRTGKHLAESDSPDLTGYLERQRGVLLARLRGLKESPDRADPELLRQTEEDLGVLEAISRGKR